jgi:beta-N-acetylhexosaminidase
MACAERELLPRCRERLTSEQCAEIGQLLVAGFGGARDPHSLRLEAASAIARDIAELHVGGVILFAPSRGARNVESPAQLAALVSELREHARASRARAGLAALPLLVSIDQEGGAVDRLPASRGFAQVTFPARTFGLALEQAREPAQRRQVLAATRRYARALAAQLRALGIDWNLAPSVDVNLDPASPAIGALGRSFSAHPDVVADLAGEFTAAFSEQGVLATLKHFPGHGSARADSHTGFVDVTAHWMREPELAPYRRLLASGYQDAILVGHLVNGAIDRTQCKAGAADDPRTWCPASMSRASVSGLLRDELGFAGLVVADDMTMAAIASEFSLARALERSLDAGVDVFLVGNHARHETQRFVDTIADGVAEGRIDAARVRRAAERVREMKLRLHSREQRAATR